VLFSQSAGPRRVRRVRGCLPAGQRRVAARIGAALIGLRVAGHPMCVRRIQARRGGRLDRPRGGEPR